MKADEWRRLRTDGARILHNLLPGRPRKELSEEQKRRERRKLRRIVRGLYGEQVEEYKRIEQSDVATRYDGKSGCSLERTLTRLGLP